MSDRSSWIRTLAVIAALTLIAMPALAQTDIEVNAAIQFNFSTPGARSLGLGGAFIGLADDATAAFANPAGLTNLSRPEVSVEYRSFDYTQVFTDRGNAGTPSGNGVDTIAGLRDGESSNSTSGASFASFVYPGKNWAVAAYRHELANFRATIETQGAFLASGPRYFPTKAFLDLEIAGYGIAAAFRIGDSFSIGLGAANYTFLFDSRTDRFGLQGDFYGEPDYSTDNRVNFQTMVGDDDDIGFQGGFLWNGEKVSVGGVYRQGPEFAFTGVNRNGDGSTTFQSGRSTFRVPDVYGIGVAIRPTDSFTISIDVNRVTYSNLTESTLNVIGCGGGASPEVVCLTPEVFDESAAKLGVDDATEFHLGVEYVFVNMRYPLALRLGGFTDPDHRIATNGADLSNPSDEGLAGFFRRGDDDVHYSAGIGVVFGERFQLDAAADFSDRTDTVSLSGVFRF